MASGTGVLSELHEGSGHDHPAARRVLGTEVRSSDDRRASGTYYSCNPCKGWEYCSLNSRATLEVLRTDAFPVDLMPAYTFTSQVLTLKLQLSREPASGLHPNSKLSSLSTSCSSSSSSFSSPAIRFDARFPQAARPVP